MSTTFAKTSDIDEPQSSGRLPIGRPLNGPNRRIPRPVSPREARRLIPETQRTPNLAL